MSDPFALSASPSPEDARSFALMLTHGLPALDAIAYFFPEEEDLSILQQDLGRWVRSKEVKRALKQVQGGEWHELAPAAQIQLALDKHYAELAYFLYANNYSDLSGADKLKADTCRATLEAKLAGNAGKMDALSAWMDDIRTGKVKLGGASKPLPGVLPS